MLLLKSKKLREGLKEKLEGISKLIVLLFIISILPSCIAYIERAHSETDIKEAIKNGDRLIAALEEYKKDRGIYPEELVDLVPKYIDDMIYPDLEGRFLYGPGPNKFFYSGGKEYYDGKYFYIWFYAYERTRPNCIFFAAAGFCQYYPQKITRSNSKEGWDYKK